MARWSVMAAALLLAGCGGNGSGGGGADGGATATWKATDACAVLDKAVVAATLNAAVASAKLDVVHAAGGGEPLFSQCVYTLADGRMLMFGTGQATNGSSLHEQVEHMRDQASVLSNTKAVDLPGLGKAALWSPELGSLYAFLGDGRFAAATLAQPDFRKPQPSTSQIQAADTAILRKVGA